MILIVETQCDVKIQFFKKQKMCKMNSFWPEELILNETICFSVWII